MIRKRDYPLRTEEECKIADIMGRVYREGGKFVLNPERDRIGLRDVKDQGLAAAVKDNRRAILEVLAGDPLDDGNIGWGVRSIFYAQMLEYVASTVEAMPAPAEQRAEKALYNSEYMKDLAKLSLNGSFTEYRAELLRLANRVIEYAKSSDKEAPAFVAR